MPLRREALAHLGLAITPALLRARSRALARLIPELASLSPGQLHTLLTQVLGSAFIDGVEVAILTHGAYLGLNQRAIQNNLTRTLVARVLDAVATARSRLIDQVATRYTAGISIHQLTGRILSSVQQTVWAGQDDEANVLATMASVDWKTWVRSFEREDHRDWHDDLNGVTIPVDDNFRMPSGPNAGATVYGPRDWDSLPDPREWMNCGHALEFKREVTAQDLGATATYLETVYAPERTTRTDAEIRAERGIP